MPNKVPITVPDPDDIRNAGMYDTGALIRLQTGATATGAFADVSGTGSTPTIPVAAATNYYLGFDPNGIGSSWYRIRYENAGGTRLSDWTAVFQVGDESAGLLCSVDDVVAELGRTPSDDEKALIAAKIRQVSRAIERATGRWLAPRPTDPNSTTTLTFHTEPGFELHIPKGIRAITTLGVADQDQPASGGTYTTANAADYFIDPPASEREPDEPGKWIRFRWNPAGTASYFWLATFGAQVTGSFGFAAVPADIQGVAIRASLRRFLGKGAAGTTVAIGPTGTEFVLPDLSGADREAIASYSRWRF